MRSSCLNYTCFVAWNKRENLIVEERKTLLLRGSGRDNCHGGIVLLYSQGSLQLGPNLEFCNLDAATLVWIDCLT